MSFTIELDRDELYGVKLALKNIQMGFPRAMNRALNLTVTPTRNKAVDEILKKITVKKKGVVKDCFKIKKSTWKTLRASVSAIVVRKSAKGRIPMIHYKTRKTTRGVKIQIYNDGPQILLKHAFVSTMPSGHKGIFWRTSAKVGTGIKFKKAAPGYFASLDKEHPMRRPIVELWGPTAADVFDDKPLIATVTRDGTDWFMSKLDHELLYLARMASSP